MAVRTEVRTSVFVCALCTSFAGNSYLPVLSHIGSVHRFGPTRTIYCGIDGCPATYSTSKYESFPSHVYRKHRDVLHAADGPEGEGPPGPVQNLNDCTDYCVDDGEAAFYTESETRSDDDGIITGARIKKSAALFQLKALEERHLTECALNGVITDIQSLWDVSLHSIHQQLYTYQRY